jgi:hypothetical protein
MRMHKLINDIKYWLLIFSGEDRQIINKCNHDTKRQFYKIGLLVSFIFIGSCISAIVFMTHLFKDIKWISIPIGIIWAFMVTNIYTLLLYTISPIILPTAKKFWKNGVRHTEPIDLRHQSALTFLSGSMIFRMLFISVLAIIIAQPLNVTFLSGFAQTSLNTHKIEYRIKMIVSADSNFIKLEADEKSSLKLNRFALNSIDSFYYKAAETKILEDELFLNQSKVLLDSLKKYDNFSLASKAKHTKYLVFSNHLDSLINNEIQSDEIYLNSITTGNIENYNLKNSINRINDKIQSKVNAYINLFTLLNENDFYIKRIQILLSENPLAWFITLFVCIMFLIPIYWKFKLRKTDFYNERRELEIDIIESEYEAMKIAYSEKFKQRYVDYNERTLCILMPLIEKFKSINPIIHASHKKNLDDELKLKLIEKYEYWEDSPFRTKLKTGFVNLRDEKDFINKIYK